MPASQTLHVPVSVLALQEKAKCVVPPHNPSFNASRGVSRKVFRKTSVIPAQLNISKSKTPEAI